jgi:chromosome partitioning protein
VKIVAFVNQKGGVGKTATALGIASSIRSRGGRVLVIDLDPQANATSGLGASAEGFTSGDVLASGKPGVAAQAITSTSWGDEVACIPANIALAEREHETGRPAHEFRLRTSLEGVDGYDLALIDCQPSVGELVTNALVAADYALIVTEADIDSLVGIANVMETTAVIRQHYNPDLTVAGIVVNNLDRRAGEQKYRLAELQSTYKNLVWEPHLPHRTRIADAKGAKAPIHDYGYRARDVATIYDSLSARLLKLGRGH